jgi:hypothetical protein
MKQDITDRLNELGEALLDPAEFSIIRDAVAEIEQLRARQEELRSLIAQCVSSDKPFVWTEVGDA